MVDTNALLDVARQYERLSLELSDAGLELGRSLNALTAAMPCEDYVLERVASFARKRDALQGEIDEARVKLRYAARTYEETDKHLRRLSHECAVNIRNTGNMEG